MASRSRFTRTRCLVMAVILLVWITLVLGSRAGI